LKNKIFSDKDRGENLPRVIRQKGHVYYYGDPLRFYQRILNNGRMLKNCL